MTRLLRNHDSRLAIGIVTLSSVLRVNISLLLEAHLLHLPSSPRFDATADASDEDDAGNDWEQNIDKYDEYS